MEKLLQQLIVKHKLKRSEALEAIKMVADYLKQKNPSLEKLIDGAVKMNTDDGAGDQDKN